MPVKELVDGVDSGAEGGGKLGFRQIQSTPSTESITVAYPHGDS